MTKIINLPHPERQGGMPLMQALNERHTWREYADQDLDWQDISNILWAAYGVNRPDQKRTVPSAWGLKPLVVFAVMRQGVYQYHPEGHTLELIKEGDYRHLTGYQPYVPTAALNLVFFADRDKMHHTEPRFEEILQANLERVAALDAAHCTQSVYLYCASRGLAAVVRLLCDGETFKKEFQLPASYAYVVAQTVGVKA